MGMGWGMRAYGMNVGMDMWDGDGVGMEDCSSGCGNGGVGWGVVGIGG